MKKTAIIALLLAGILLGNCATSHAGITTSNIPIADKKYTITGHVAKQVSWKTFDIGILGFPLKKPPVHSLMQEAINEKQADALVNIKYWNDKIVLLFITINRFGFEADTIKFTAQ